MTIFLSFFNNCVKYQNVIYREYVNSIVFRFSFSLPNFFLLFWYNIIFILFIEVESDFKNIKLIVVDVYSFQINKFVFVYIKNSNFNGNSEFPNIESNSNFKLLIFY
jgi:hypothetical protein